MLYSSAKNDPSILSCPTNWTERNFGSTKKCFIKLKLEHEIGKAADVCKNVGATLPLPRNEVENSDLVETAKKFGVERMGPRSFFFLSDI